MPDVVIGILKVVDGKNKSWRTLYAIANSLVKYCPYLGKRRRERYEKNIICEVKQKYLTYIIFSRFIYYYWKESFEFFSKNIIIALNA